MNNSDLFSKIHSPTGIANESASGSSASQSSSSSSTHNDGISKDACNSNSICSSCS